MIRPTEAAAQAAKQSLEAAINKFADEARLPGLRGTPNLNPTWWPIPSTLRHGRIRNGGLAWAMEANDPQIVAFYFAPQGEEPFTIVTANGHQRHNMWTNTLAAQRHIYVLDSPWGQWYNYHQRCEMDQQLRRH